MRYLLLFTVTLACLTVPFCFAGTKEAAKKALKVKQLRGEIWVLRHDLDSLSERLSHIEKNIKYLEGKIENLVLPRYEPNENTHGQIYHYPKDTFGAVF